LARIAILTPSTITKSSLLASRNAMGLKSERFKADCGAGCLADLRRPHNVDGAPSCLVLRQHLRLQSFGRVVALSRTMGEFARRRKAGAIARMSQVAAERCSASS
jgi:hypothetical protein